MKSISPIIAVVILLLMTVAAGGMAYITITSFQQTTQAQGAGGIQQLGQQAGTILKVESVKGGTVYIRNIGTTDITGVKIYADGKEIGSCDEVAEGKYCIIQLNETVDCGADQKCTLTIGAATAPTVTGELTVEENELAPMEICRNVTAYCGDWKCDGYLGENIRNCPSDCTPCQEYCYSKGLCDDPVNITCFVVLVPPPSLTCGDHICDKEISHWEIRVGQSCPAGATCVECNEDCTCLFANRTPEGPPDGYCDVFFGGETPISCPEDCLRTGEICTPTDRICQGLVETSINSDDSCTCGDGICDWGENATSCPTDCGSGLEYCSNGMCELGNGENATNCPGDCTYCHNPGSTGGYVCDSIYGETAANCLADCAVHCGDGVCNFPWENVTNCPADCSGTCPENCPGACGDGYCNIYYENATSCPTDCFCGDKICDPTEVLITCPRDCQGTCGDGYCNIYYENAASCPADCP